MLVHAGGGGDGVTWKGMNKIHIIMYSSRRMIEKIRQLTSCVSPGGGGHGVTWKGINEIYVIMHSNGRMM